jgi:alpha-L-arabinofuranosidase
MGLIKNSWGGNVFAPQAQMTVLTSARLTDNNSLEKPASVVPAVSNITIPGTDFTHEFPANSLTVLRLGVRQIK